MGEHQTYITFILALGDLTTMDLGSLLDNCSWYDKMGIFCRHVSKLNAADENT